MHLYPMFVCFESPSKSDITEFTEDGYLAEFTEDGCLAEFTEDGYLAEFTGFLGRGFILTSLTSRDSFVIGRVRLCPVTDRWP